MSIKAGDQIGSLVAVKFVERRKGHTYWEFRCVCGGSHIAVPQNVKNQLRTEARCSACRVGSKAHGWLGHGEIGHDTFTVIKQGAKARDMEFSVTIEYLWDLFLKQDRRCALTGWPIEFHKTYKTKKLKTASLDRIDSTEGYVEGNLQWVHRDVNKLKKNLEDSRFIELCLAVAAHQFHCTYS